MRMVEAKFEDDQLFPVRGKADQQTLFRRLADRFSTFHDFALAELDKSIHQRKLMRP